MQRPPGSCASENQATRAVLVRWIALNNLASFDGLFNFAGGIRRWMDWSNACSEYSYSMRRNRSRIRSIMAPPASEYYRLSAGNTNGWPMSFAGSAFFFGRNFATLLPCALAT